MPSLSIQPGWNLIGLMPYNICYGELSQTYVCPYLSGQYQEQEHIAYCQIDPLMSQTLANIQGQYRRITSFDPCQGAMIYDSQLPPFINTLHYIGPKYGYWIKIDSQEEITCFLENL